MKKITKIAIGAIALTAMSFTAANVNPVEQAVTSMSEVALSTAVSQGYISAADKQKVMQSGIVEAMAQTLVETNYDLAATVDKGAEIAVEKGWFRSKEAAKGALRQALEKARNDQSIVNAAYRLLGI